MRTAPLALVSAAALLALADRAAAQAYTLDIDPAQSTFTFGGSTSVGPIVGTPDNFALDGTGGIDVAFGCDGLAESGRFNGGDAFTIPSVLSGQIGLIIPLASLTITDLRVTLVSSSFAIAPDGSFATEASLLVLSGTADFVPLIGEPGTLDLAGFTSAPSPATGQVVVTASTLQVIADVSFDIPIDSKGVTGTLELNGVVDGTGPRTTTFCDGSDGALASCPCANEGGPDAGCDVPQGTGGVQLTLAAKESAPANRATLLGCGFPSMGSPAAIVIRAPVQEPAPVVFGDGLRCIGVPLVRLSPSFASGGASSHVIGHGAMAGPGSFSYQLWFRSTPATFCDAAAAFNLSNGVQLEWP